MFTFNGIGTKLYGSTDVGPDGSYITTKWFVFVYLPVIPLASYRVIKQGSTNLVVFNSQEYLMQAVPMHTKQVTKTYLWVYGIIGAIVLLTRLF